MPTSSSAATRSTPGPGACSPATRTSKPSSRRRPPRSSASRWRASSTSSASRRSASGPAEAWLIPLREVAGRDAREVGGKALRLAQLAKAGFRTPGGFSIAAEAYRAFVAANGLASVIRMELGRKPMEEMRWEEIWDAALRIRSAFLAAPLSPALRRALEAALAGEPEATRWAVRSSAPGEDGEGASFAGLHESRTELVGADAVLDAVRVVWASLWSDAALLYRRELALDPTQSAMAVLVQPMLDAEVSGVAFGRDPRKPGADRAIVEAVPGACGGLVDGRVDPDRYELSRPDGALLEWRAGEREDTADAAPLLAEADLTALMRALLDVESLFGWAPDLEWTDRDARLALLQARPVTAAAEPDPEGDDRRAWYLSLRPGAGRARRVRSAEDLGRFRDGEVLVCDAIQPTMTQLVPLCAAIVERRGGMLIHGAIIARELGIPCVNGVAAAVEQVRDGDWLAVDGDLGLVTVGAPEFELETGKPR